MFVVTLLGVAIAAFGAYVAWLTYKSGASPITIIYNIAASALPFVKDVVPSPESVTVESDGISATLKTMAFKGSSLRPSILLVNKTSSRVYIRDVREDPAQVGTLESGANVESPSPTGIPVCGTAQSCISSAPEKDIVGSGSIEPGGQLEMSLSYTVWNESEIKDTFAFSLVLAARFADANDPTTVGAPIIVRLTFPPKNITRE